MGDGSENASGTVIENVVSSDYQGKLAQGTNGLNVTYEEDTLIITSHLTDMLWNLMDRMMN